MRLAVQSLDFAVPSARARRHHRRQRQLAGRGAVVARDQWKKFIALAKAERGRINDASSAQRRNHLNAALFAQRPGIELQRVQYKGGGPAVVNLMAGQVQMFLYSPSSMVPHIEAGKLRALGVSGEQRLHAETRKILSMPDTVAILTGLGMLALISTPEEFAM